MTGQEKQPQSLFPDYPREVRAVNKEGNLNSFWDLGLQSLFQGLQKNFSNEGILFPSLTIDQLNTIAAIYTPYIGKPLPQETPSGQLSIPDISGKTVFDSTNRVPKEFIITYDNATPPNVISAQWYMINVMIFNAGLPPTSLIATLYSFCYDTVGKVLYICTAVSFGPPPVATWTPV